MDLAPRLADAAAKLPAVRLAVLFGSQASGRGRADSDVDVAIALDPDTPDLRREAESALVQAAQADLDLVFLPEAPPYLRFRIAREGVLLHESALGAWRDEMARAMIEWWDWQPVATAIHRDTLARLRRKVANGP